MKTIMVTTNTAATSMTQPSKMSWLKFSRESSTATAMLAAEAAPRAK